MEFPKASQWRPDPSRKRSRMGGHNSVPLTKLKNEESGMRKPFKLRRKWSDTDTQNYRDGYPGKQDNLHHKKNLMFYKNELPSHPNGDYIDNIHQDWSGDWAKLERHHGYIQWLFPIREAGMNFSAQELQLHEAKAIQDDPKCRERVIKSYRLMLDFYGMEMEDESTGWLKRSQHWQERFRNLNLSFHNYLRITRILKSLGELGFEHLKTPFCEFVLIECLEQSTLMNCLDSCLDYWRNTIKDDTERTRLSNLANQLLGYDLGDMDDE